MFENPWPIASKVQPQSNAGQLSRNLGLIQMPAIFYATGESDVNHLQRKAMSAIFAPCTLLDALISLPWIMSMAMYLGERYALKHSSAFRNSCTIREIHTNIQMREIPR